MNTVGVARLREVVTKSLFRSLLMTESHFKTKKYLYYFFISVLKILVILHQQPLKIYLNFLTVCREVMKKAHKKNILCRTKFEN